MGVQQPLTAAGCRFHFLHRSSPHPYFIVTAPESPRDTWMNRKTMQGDQIRLAPHAGQGVRWSRHLETTVSISIAMGATGHLTPPPGALTIWQFAQLQAIHVFAPGL